MKVPEFLKQLRSLGITLRSQGDRLVCNAPKGALTPELGSEIRIHKNEILRFLEQGEEIRGADRPPLRRLGHAGPYPLSYSQQRVWFIESLGEPSALYNGPAAFRMRGPFDLEAMRSGILEIIRRHDIMRTAIEVRDGEPVQIVFPKATIEIPMHAMGGHDDALARAMDYLAERTRIPFELHKAPLFRAELIELSAEDHVLFFMPHHIIWDGWSFDVFLAELKVLYEAFSKGQPSPLPAPSIQYADYAVWQQSWLEGGELERQLRYWRERLAGELPVLRLNTDFERPPMRSSKGGRLIRVMPQEFADRLTQLARQEGATLYMALLAAYKILLCRYTGQEDILVGAPMAGNSVSETERMVGFFVNTIVLRTDLSGDPSYREVLRRVQETCVGAFSHQDVPFEKLVEHLQPSRDLSRTPIHQTEFGLQEASRRPRSFGQLRLEQLIVEQDVVGTDVIFWVKTDGDCLPLALDYSTPLFAKDTVEQMLENLETLLVEALAAPDTRISELPILNGARQLSLRDLGRGPRAKAPDTCVHEWIERRCAAAPDAIALLHRDRTVTYGALDRRANQLARHLISRGVGRESLVGICMERCPEMVIGLLAIHKAGGAYLPLDPTYPRERLAHMVADSRVGVVLTSRRSEALLASTGAKCVFLDEIDQQLDRLEASKPAVATLPRQLAYAIYTSGSTGGPKGVLVEHRNVTNFLTGMAEAVSFESGGCWLAVTSISFDISVLEIFGSLAHGFAVVLYEGFSEATKDGGAIASLIERHHVTHLQCTPSQARMLTYEAESREKLGRLAQILVGGEALPIDLAKELTALCPRVVNMYGPTETTVWSTFSVLEPKADRVSIGRPLANQHVYVLDRHRCPVPRGVTGELFIGGAGVARGYLDRPELTAERFLADPFVDESGARMYRTGDLVRFDRDGRLQFVGRVDTQVKLRGHRVELGEIEHALQRHGSVDQAVAIVREDNTGDHRLTAYVTAAAGSAVEAGDLREHLVRALPAFMVPAAIVVLEKLPLTPNGKIDRRALPAPQLAAEPRTYSPPDTIERIEDPDRWWWQPVWNPVQPSATAEVGGPFLVFLDGLGIGTALVERLRARGQTVATVVSSGTFAKVGESAYALNPESEVRGYCQLYAALKSAGQLPAHIVHLWMITRGEVSRAGSTFFHRNLEHGFDSLHHLGQAFGPEAGRGLALTVFCNQALAVAAGEAVPHPEKAMVLGPCSVIPRDHPGFGVDVIDLELRSEAGPSASLKRAEIVDCVDAILGNLRRPTNSVRAFRGGRLHELAYERLPPPRPVPGRSPLVAGGTYLILGALSDHGLAFLEFAATAAKVQLVLVDELAMPAPDEWHSWVGEPRDDDPVSRAVAALRRLEVRGSHATTFVADLSDPDAMRSLLGSIEERQGRIRGVLHAVPTRHLRPRDDAEAAIGRNMAVHGLRTLASLFEGRSLDFCIVATPADYAVAPPGRVDAVAVGAYASAWITKCAFATDARAIGWGPWRRVAAPWSQQPGRMNRSSLPIELDDVHLATRGIDPAEARAALDQWLSGTGPRQVILSSIDLHQHRNRMAEIAAVAPDTSTHDGPRDDIERRLHRLWSETLATEELGIRDDFFDVGGHSLVAARLFHRIRREFGIEWPLSRLFEAPNIERSAVLLRKALGREPLVAGEGTGTRESSPFRYLVPMQTTADPTARPVFLVSGQFGNVLNLRHLAGHLGSYRPVYGIQGRGLLGEESPHATYEEMGADYLEEIRAVQPHGPYLIVGFCSGGIAAFEMAMQLLAARERVAFLGFLDSGIPNWPLLSPADRLRIHASRLRRIGPSYLARWLKERLRWERGRIRSWLVPPPPPSATEYQFDKMRQAFLRQTAAYRPGRYPGEVTLFRPRLERQHDLGNGRWSSDSGVIVLPDNGWTHYVKALEILEVGGDHDRMVLEPHVHSLAAALEVRLARAETSSVDAAVRKERGVAAL